MSHTARKFLIKNANLTVAKEAEELIQLTYGHQWLSELCLNDDQPSTSKPSEPNLGSPTRNFVGFQNHVIDNFHFDESQFHELLNALNHGHGVLNENSNMVLSECSQTDFLLHPYEYSFLGFDRASIRTNSNFGEDVSGCLQKPTDKDEAKESDPEDYEKNNLVCLQCGFFANNRKQLWRHGKREKHKIREGRIKKDKRAPTSYNCQSCKFTTNSSFNLMRHIQRIHINDKRFTCTECCKSFKDNYTLETHIKYVHRKERNFACKDCNKAFVSSSDFHRHRRIVHENLKRFPCADCGKTFHTSSNAKRHQEGVCRKNELKNRYENLGI